jgi:D-alanyl-D-alanine carboxypeptidase
MSSNTMQNSASKRHRVYYPRMIAALFIAVFFIGAFHCLLFYGRDCRQDAVAASAENQFIFTGGAYMPEADSPRDNRQLPNEDTDWNLTVVNRWNPIPQDYDIVLVEVPGGEKVDERIYTSLMQMLEAAKAENWDQLPVITSGYRTQEQQQQLYDEKIAAYKQQGYSDEEATALAEQWVAIPGHSEHQIGIAVDISAATYDLYLWLQQNSYRYGFILRYPAEKTQITGTAEEIWHYRYVGVEAAMQMYEQGLCLEEYMENRTSL